MPGTGSKKTVKFRSGRIPVILLAAASCASACAAETREETDRQGSAHPKLVDGGKKTATPADEAAFKPIFDGKTLDGWKAPDMSYWSVEDEAITAKITKQHPCTVNQFLVWQGGELDDFELKLTFRMTGSPNINGGFQFRSKLLPNHDVAGYQVDNNRDTKWLVRLYDEHGRHTLAWRGQKTAIGADGKMTHSAIPGAEGPAKFKLEDWHEYHLICVGTHLTLKVNGRVVAEVIDDDPKQQDLSGILALQLHSGPPMTVQFKDIRLKRKKGGQ